MASPTARLAARLGLHFRDLSLLTRALVHSSYPHEHPEAGLSSNERLEYLGDAVVGLIIADALFARHPEESEGQLTTRQAAIVSTRGLSRIAARLDLGSELLVGQGAELTGERRLRSVQAGALEALVAAVYLDQGLEVARDHLLRWASPELDSPALSAMLKAPKSRLQEHAVATRVDAPRYHVISAEGPDHAKHYVVEVRIGGRTLGRGEGRNRRDAETQAAYVALEHLEGRDQSLADEDDRREVTEAR